MANNINNVKGSPHAGPNIPAPDLRPMEELLQVPTDGVGDAIVVPPILASQFELKIGLLNLVTDSRFMVLKMMILILISKAGGNLLTRNTQEALTIIENKSKIHSIQDSCDSCGGSHSSYECQAINNMNQEEVYAYSGNEEPSVPPPPLSSSSKEVERDLGTITDQLPEKPEDPGKFLILCDFPELEKYMTLADLGVSINLMPLFVWKNMMLPELIPTRMTLDLANRSVAYPAGIAEDGCVQVGKFTFPADFFVVDYDVDPRVPLILGRPFLRTARALVDVYGEELSKRRTTSTSDSFLSFTSSKTSDSSLEEFADELALLDPFPPGNEDDNFNPKADLREIKYLLNRDPLTDSSPKTNIDIIDAILERFIDEPTLVYSFPQRDEDADLLEFKSDNKEWKKILYRDLFDNIHSENEKDKDLKIECLIDYMDYDFFPLLPISDSTRPEESSEIATLMSFPFGNEDKLFNPGILILGGTQIFHEESKDKDLKLNSSTEALLILVEKNFLSHSSDRELLFFLESIMIETLL
uniref:Reverse transcriptase domain-containing protein n=1 Tax=Tanacetum cinerariifolium TaxID=118510 RepID=A0A6L2JTV2_TANCI|nr:reverse transcriptase domain-containing protein [Tanacetum cinerariifolium]